MFTGNTLFVGCDPVEASTTFVFWAVFDDSTTFAFLAVVVVSSSESEAFLLLGLACLGGIGVHFTRL